MNLGFIVLAAGKGTRMRSVYPKVQHQVLGLPMIIHSLKIAVDMRAHPIVVVVGNGAESVKGLIKSHMPQQYLEKVFFAYQEKQLGTGHATLQADPFFEDFSGDILIIPGDAPLITAQTLNIFWDWHRDGKHDISVISTELDYAGNYGRILRFPDHSVERIVEAKDATPEIMQIREINTGVYLVSKKLLFDLLKEVRNKNAQEEYYLTDIIEIAVKKGFSPKAFLHHDKDEFSGINTCLELNMAEEIFRHRVLKKWMQSGVTLLNTYNTKIETEVSISTDVVISSGVEIRGKSYIGSNVYIDTGSILKDVIIEPGCHIGAYSYLKDIHLKNNTTILPFTKMQKD